MGDSATRTVPTQFSSAVLSAATLNGTFEAFVDRTLPVGVPFFMNDPRHFAPLPY
jgi:hypothetical protein